MSVTKLNNILIILARGIGDFICTTSFLKHLSKLNPDSNIIFICYDVIKLLVESCPYINKAIYINDYDDDVALMNEILSTGSIKLAINLGCSNNSLANKIMYLSAAKRRVAFEKDDFVELIKTPDNILHIVDKYLYVLEYLYNKKFDIDPWELTDEKINIDTNKINVSIGTGGTNSSKKYPYYAKVISAFPDIVFHILGEEKINLPNCINYDINIKQVISIIKQSNLLVSNDTCYVHVASVFKIPCIVLYKESKDKYNYFLKNKINNNYSSIDNWHPWRNTQYEVLMPAKAKFPCSKKIAPSGCDANFSHCIAGIKPDEIINTIKKILLI